MSLEQEIREQIENIKKLKMEVGNINNHLSALEGLCRKDKDEAYLKGYDDATKAICSDEQSIADKAYQSGFEDGRKVGIKDGMCEAWETAKKIVCDDSFDWNTLFHIFNSRSFEVIFGNFSASEAVARLKAYEGNKDDSIKVGDDAYKRGHEDDKDEIENGCRGCKWESKKGDEEPCKHCRNAYLNEFTPMPKDEIRFGDEVVDIDGEKGIVVSRDNDCGDAIWVMFKECRVPLQINKGRFLKTGVHRDIDSYFEEI